jgi:hypothetical protein
VNKETRLRGDIDCGPRWPFATLAARSTLAIPTCPRGRSGAGWGINCRPAAQTGCRGRSRATFNNSISVQPFDVRAVTWLLFQSR